MKRHQLLERLDLAWTDFENSYAGLTPAQLMIPRVTGEWSVRDIIAHVTWWEQEALKTLPVIRGGGRNPRYSVTYGGIDAFNAMMTVQRSALTLADVLAEHDKVHAELIEYVTAAPEELYVRESRFRRRLRFDTYEHYPVHARAIREWREANQSSQKS
ncbi:MAG: DinB family protein [Gemmatimonadaceae bacterium]